jgi:hypothetical protein
VKAAKTNTPINAATANAIRASKNLAMQSQRRTSVFVLFPHAPAEAALLISNNASKLSFRPCVLLLKGFDGVLERQHVGRLGAGWTRWRDLLLVNVNHHEVMPSS